MGHPNAGVSWKNRARADRWRRWDQERRREQKRRREQGQPKVKAMFATTLMAAGKRPATVHRLEGA